MGQDRITKIEIPVFTGKTQDQRQATCSISVLEDGWMIGDGVLNGKPVLIQRSPASDDSLWKWVNAIIIQGDDFDEDLIEVATFFIPQQTRALLLMAEPGSNFHKWIDGEPFVSDDPGVESPDGGVRHA